VLREHPTELSKFVLALVTDMANGKLPRADGDFHPKKDEDNKYMRAVNMSEFLDKWILALLAAQPRPTTDGERLDFHKKYLESLVSKE
jgi:hypothetical protein